MQAVERKAIKKREKVLKKQSQKKIKKILKFF
jgi:hypothetical protein